MKTDELFIGLNVYHRLFLKRGKAEIVRKTTRPVATGFCHGSVNRPAYRIREAD